MATRLGTIALIAEGLFNVESSHLRITRMLDDAYRRVAVAATLDVLEGAITRRDGAQRALDSFADVGITGFVDRAGRNWDLASYAEMAVRTVSGHAAVQGHSDRLQGAGRDLVIVSVHGGACPLCSPYEGRILSLSGADQRYASLNDATSAGLFHPHCRHATAIFVPGLTEPLEPPPREQQQRAFELSQVQRYHERQIRKWKRREAVAVTPEAKALGERKVREWQGRTRELVRSRGLDRRYDRETIVRAR